MKVVLLAGGFGTRISEETDHKPKPMVEIGGRPILWHIMKIYAHYGFTEFVVCLGYKGYVIKEYFANYFLHQSDVTIDMAKNELTWHQSQAEPWKVTLIDTGLETMTGGRIKRVQHVVGNEPFMLTYGDGLANIDIKTLLDFHKSHGKYCTVTSVQPVGRWGALNLDDNDSVLSFQEKPKGDGAWVNGGFFVCQPEVFGYIDGDADVWEKKPLENLANDMQLTAFKHGGFWKPMDTLRDKIELEAMWSARKAEWKTWK
ncbi:MAG: glucose-1-phosphate cytidylyltransferase [Bacteroidota bacterium]